MHYIRLLRPAKLEGSPGRGGLVLSLLFTITTDLGDSFLCPGAGSLELTAAVVDPAATSADLAAVVRRDLQACTCRWTAGMRVLEAKIRLLSGLRREDVNCTVSVYPTQQHTQGKSMWLGALHVGDVLPWRVDTDEGLKMGVVMPVTVEIVNGVCAPVSLRTLALGKARCGEDDGGDGLDLQFKEDIGESIARHIWDAGVITLAYLADACASPESIRAVLPIERKDINILELGSGVGILGITIASILPEAAAAQGKTLSTATVLLTDLEEAEERARSNIAIAEAKISNVYSGDTIPTVKYENLNWDEGREGRFGSLAAATPWDLIVLSDCTYNVDSLPALVGTLSALHDAKKRHLGSKDDYVKSVVLLATKPRHSSEQALFPLLKNQSWRYRVVKEIPLPKIGEDDEVVQIYLLEKGGRPG
ncbi:hypothetical protein F5Y19DRAFT_244678 [Xylariaceae sp. FL1651]|nr:hypothetical protein F5Y19DRAFT_244678 [Xylariaceae sp. FL1651]